MGTTRNVTYAVVVIVNNFPVTNAALSDIKWKISMRLFYIQKEELSVFPFTVT
jgi:hypothetical protein